MPSKRARGGLFQITKNRFPDGSTSPVATIEVSDGSLLNTATGVIRVLASDVAATRPRVLAAEIDNPLLARDVAALEPATSA